MAQETTMTKKEWKEYSLEVPLASGVTAEYNDFTLTVKGAKGETKKYLKYPYVNIEVKDGNVVIGTKRYTKRQKKIIHTYRAHVKNLIEGVTNGFEYKLAVVFAKFPMTVTYQGNVLTVKNLLGEKVPRTVKITQNVEVKVNGAEITVTGIDKEECGQAAALIEQSCRITHLDRRVIQDGIFITSKPHKEYI